MHPNRFMNPLTRRKMRDRKDYQKKWALENKDKIAATKKKFREKNKEKIAAYSKAYRHRDRLKEKIRYIKKNNPTQMDLLRIIILQATGVDIKDQSRKRGIVDVKRIFSTMARRKAKHTLEEIGDYLGRDHATIIHHIKTCDDLKQTDKEFNQKYLTIENILKS